MIYLSSSLIVMALTVAIFSGCGTTDSSSSSTMTTTTTANASSAGLVINRAANMGSGLFLNVSVDGKKVATVSAGQHYSGLLSPGSHVVSVVLSPNELNLAPTQKKITAQAGQTYTFVASWQGDTLLLQ